MANADTDHSTYYIPHNGWYPVWLAAGVMLMLTGLATWLNDTKAGEPGSWIQSIIGFGMVAVVLYFWFGKVIAENHQGLAGEQLKRSYVWAMGWFIFSEVMFFAAFFGALFYARSLAVAWLGGEGEKGLTGDYLWPDFDASWPVMNNPDSAIFPSPEENMAMPTSLSGWLGYLPFYNTVILLTSSWTVHIAHIAIKEQQRKKLVLWLGITVLLGMVFLVLQVLLVLQVSWELLVLQVLVLLVLMEPLVLLEL